MTETNGSIILLPLEQIEKITLSDKSITYKFTNGNYEIERFETVEGATNKLNNIVAHRHTIK